MATVANRADAALPVTADAPAFRVGSRPAPGTRPAPLRTDTGPRRTRLAGNVSIDMDQRRAITPDDHMRIVEAVAARDADLAASRMRAHIRRRREEATEAARMAFSRLYVPH